ncbi:hypothetical protein WEH80_03270 [Actinomycetes bacterium KLBMP 9759]
MASALDGRVDGQRWVLALEHDGVRSCVPIGLPVEPGRTVLVGREGDLPLGVEIEDRGVSRVAAEVTATEQGWQVEIPNRNGAMLHPWGQPPTLAGRHNALVWPRIAFRVLTGADGSDPRRHWVLLESDMIAPTAAGARVADGSGTSTYQPARPRPMSDGQLAALRAVFADHLRWPPASPAEALTLAAAGRRLGITESGVQDRLDRAIKRAMRLGLPRAFGSTNPEYLYVLVRAGYVPLPAHGLHRLVLS